MATDDPLSEVAIANMAIDVLEDYPISSLTESGPVAEFMYRNFGRVRDSVQQAFPYPFSLELVNLAKDGTDPAFGWDYRYEVPSDFIAIHRLSESGTHNAPPIRHQLIGRYIHTNYDAPLPLVYIKRVTNVALWTPLAADVLAMTLAVRGAMNITGKSSYYQKASNLLAVATENARLAETLGAGTPESQNRHAIIDIRGVGMPS
jgi:hypothetical protein